MQGLSSYANNIMGHTMNQYAAQSSLLSTQVISKPAQHLCWTLLLCRYRRWTTTSRRPGEEAFQAQGEPHHQHQAMEWAARLQVTIKLILLQSKLKLNLFLRSKLTLKLCIKFKLLMIVFLLVVQPPRSLQRPHRQPLAQHPHSLGMFKILSYLKS